MGDSESIPDDAEKTAVMDELTEHQRDGDVVDVSVVIPTYNRRDRLLKLLAALDRQITTIDGHDFTFEVVVVSDGSTDGTTAAVADHHSTFPLRFFEQANGGPATARNRGIDASAGRIVVFIDDDVFPEPECLAAHVAQHAGCHDLVVIGPMLTPPDTELSPWVAWEQYQLEKQYRSFETDPTVYHRQFYTGNASLPRAALQRVGGFDTSYRRAEDVELAHRLHLDGLHFVFEPAARAYHYAERSFDAWCQMADDYGRNDVTFARSGQPDVMRQIRGFFAERHAAQRWLIRVVVPRPERTESVRRVLVATSSGLARIGLRGAAQRALSMLYGLNYYAGVADELGGTDEFERLIDGTLTHQLVGWFVLEQTLGHITHGKNLQALLPQIADLEAEFVLVDDSLGGPLRHAPGWSNWTVRAGIRARRGVRALHTNAWVNRPDAMFVHSQVPAILLGRWMKKVPTVLSLDATPLQYDSLGEFYQHEVGTGPGERFKKWLNQRCYHRARHLVTWSEWAKQGLVDDYGVRSEDVTVIAPGVDVSQWARPEGVEPSGPLRVLFVGGDLERKGGHLLLEAARRLRLDDDVDDFEVHLVTPSAVPDEPGVFAHPGLTANSPALIEQYHLADIFCLPTRGDCLPMVLAEAGAAGLPLISTDVGAISEVVRDDETGHLIEPDDLEGLIDALKSLLTDAERRARCGRQARTLIEESHDARVNADRIVAVLRRAALGAS